MWSPVPGMCVVPSRSSSIPCARLPLPLLVLLVVRVVLVVVALTKDEEDQEEDIGVSVRAVWGVERRERIWNRMHSQSCLRANLNAD
jgi:hypothetical protein